MQFNKFILLFHLVDAAVQEFVLKCHQDDQDETIVSAEVVVAQAVAAEVAIDTGL